MVLVDIRVPAIIVGVLFSIINAVVTVYLALKTGMADGIILLLLFLSFFVFAATRSAKTSTFVYMIAIMMSSIAPVIAYTDGLGAIILSGKHLAVPDYVMMAMLSLSGIIGMLLSFYFTDYFLKDRFTWPMSKVIASIIAMLAAEKKDLQFKASALRMGAMGVASGAFSLARGLGAVPEMIGTMVAGVSLSPMMVGIGMLIGFRACAQVALGALLSLAVLIFVEGGVSDYTSHMLNPWVFSTSMSIMVTSALITLYVIVKPFFAELRNRRRERNEKIPLAARDGGEGVDRGRNPALLLLIIVTVAAVMLHLFVGVPAWIFLISIPVATLFAIIESRGRAEISMSVGISSFVIILLVGLAFEDIVPLLILEGFVAAMVMSFSIGLSVFKTADYSHVSRKGLAQMLAIGSITGGVICIPIIRVLNDVYGIGTAALPAPYSVMWLEMAGSAVTRIIPPSINLYLILLGIGLAFVLHRYKISAVSIAMGLLLPFYLSGALFLGGIIAWYIAKKGYLKGDNGITASGLIAGDIVIGLALSLRALL